MIAVYVHIYNIPIVIIIVAIMDGLFWWSPSRVLSTNYSVCKCMCDSVCVTDFCGSYYSGPSW